MGGLEEIQVARVSTGQVLASWLFRIDAESPGLFTVDGSGSGQVAALNQDGSVNNGANPAKAGSVVTLFATGQGAMDGMPPDGQAAQGIVGPSRPRRSSSIRVLFLRETCSSRAWRPVSRDFGRSMSKCRPTRRRPM